MNNIMDKTFKRIFSVSMYKNLKISIGEMSFFKDFIHDSRGDLYPVIDRSDVCSENVKNGFYKVKGGYVERMFCRFFPYAAYEVSAALTDGEVGFSFRLPGTRAAVMLSREYITYMCGENIQKVCITPQNQEKITMIVQCRPSAFDIYLKKGCKPEYLYTFEEKAFMDSNLYNMFSNGTAALVVSGCVKVDSVQAYIDNGVSIADIRPIKYENGEVITEHGKIFFTASVRMQSGSFQAVFSWIPTTTSFEMTGAVFYDCGDGRWRGYLAPVIMYNRRKKLWYVWVSSFEHEHILAHGVFSGDPRYGINIIDVQIMERAQDGADISTFAGFKGDEDPDLIYDEEHDRWLMAICRLDPKTQRYVYVFFESDDAFGGYTYLGKGYDGNETGGSYLLIDGKMFFICGNDAFKTSEYRIYSKNEMKKAVFDYHDGGFRGWGCVFPIRMGSRTRYFWLTFDRHNGSDYQWSYGNVYCFELDLIK